MNEFYMRLPSNRSMNIYLKNRTSAYVTKIPDEITSRDDGRLDWRKYRTHSRASTSKSGSGTFTVDAKNVANIENDHTVWNCLSVTTRLWQNWLKNNRNVSCQHAVRSEFVINVTFDVVTGKFTMRLLEGVRVHLEGILLYHKVLG